jgi:ATP-dependent RNA helicase RhlE
MKSFKDFGFLPTLQKSLQELKFREPTEIQAKTIPIMMGGQGVVGVSETGSGKTLAYALPLLHHLKSLEIEGDGVQSERAPRGVVVVPTRELGEQVAKVFKSLTHETRLRVRTALGGQALEQARRNTGGPFEILLATPGRLVQMMELELIELDDVRTLIFDEADQMMDQGFLDDTINIAKACGAASQMSLFSATVNDKVREMITDLFSETELIESQGSGKTVVQLTTQNLRVPDGERWPLFEKLLSQKNKGTTMIFTNTREQCEKLAEKMKAAGFECVEYRGEMDKGERRQNLKQFRDGKIQFLVSTDLAGRGLDIDSVDRVINYHLPQQFENYLHRAGRTARAGRKGLVVNLVTERDSRLMDKVMGAKAGTHRDLWLRDDPRAKARAKAKPLAARKKKEFKKNARDFAKATKKSRSSKSKTT